MISNKNSRKTLLAVGLLFLVLSRSWTTTYQDHHSSLCQPTPLKELASVLNHRIYRNASTPHDHCVKARPGLMFNRPYKGKFSSFPYISMDGFREVADCIFDETECPFTIDCLKFNGAIVFIRTEYEEKWFKDVHPKVIVNYVLISGNSDSSAPRTSVAKQHLNDSRLMAWFAENLIMSHPKLRPLPIGPRLTAGPSDIVQLKDLWKAKLSKNFDDFSHESRLLVYFRFVSNRVMRMKAQECLKRSEFYNNAPFEVLNASSLTKALKLAQFVPSPVGNGIDCHRTWEALSLGAVPIIIKLPTMNSMLDCLPVIQVDDFCDILQPGVLKREWERLQNNTFDLSKILMSYWIMQILKAAGRM